MTVDSIEGLFIVAVIITAMWGAAVLALAASLLSRLFNVPVSLTVGTVFLIGPPLLWFPWTHKHLGWLFVAVILTGVLLVGRAAVRISRSRRDSAEQPMMQRRSLSRPERYRVGAALATLVGILLMPLAARFQVAGVVVPVAWMLGFVLWVAALGFAARKRREDLRQHTISYDPSLATELGRYVEGRWVCFEHDRRWCPVCAGRARRQGATPEPLPAEEFTDGHSLT